MTGRVLVVDDSIGSAALVRSYLKFEHLEVALASDGVEALAAFAEGQPDLIVLDLVMSRLDGFEVCGRIKSDPVTSHIPILVLSSLDTPRDRSHALNVGADVYLTKPVARLPFIARVKSLIQWKCSSISSKFPVR